MEEVPELIKLLRAEANEVKECFTRFSFQAIALSAIIFGFLLKFGEGIPWISLSSVLITILILTVSRIGIHKYTTANRHFAFEMFFSRSERYENEKANTKSSKVEKWLRTIAWEEAVFAWRVVNSTLFEGIYLKRSKLSILPDRLKRGFRKAKRQARKQAKSNNNSTNENSTIENAANDAAKLWFLPTIPITKNHAKYYAGSYLRTMQSFLTLIGVLSLMPIGLAIFTTAKTSHSIEKTVFILISSVLLVLGMFFLLVRLLKDSKRRRMLEEGIQSIYSMSIIWEITAVAHAQALIGLKADPSLSYVEALSKEASKVNVEKPIDYIKIGKETIEKEVQFG